MSSDSSDKSPPLHIELHLPSGLRSAAEARTAAKALAAQAWQCDEAQFDLVFEPGVFVPTSAHVEVVPPAEYRTRKLQAVKYTLRLLVASLTLGLGVFAGWSLLIERERLRGESQRHVLAHAVEDSRARAERANAKSEIDAAATKIWDGLTPKLELNLNPVFDRLEAIHMPQVRLVSMDVDATTRTVIVSYQLPNFAHLETLADLLAQPSPDRMSCRIASAHARQVNIILQWRCTF